jgi:hypothetical protein
MKTFKTFAQIAEKAHLELEARQGIQRAKQVKRLKAKTSRIKAELGQDLLNNGFQEEPLDPTQVGLGELSTDDFTPEELVEMSQPHEPLLVDWDMYASPNPARWS